MSGYEGVPLANLRPRPGGLPHVDGLPPQGAGYYAPCIDHHGRALSPRERQIREALNAPPVDHEQRAARLSVFADACYRVNGESLDSAGVTIDEGEAQVPYRYVLSTHGNDGTWLVFTNHLTDMPELALGCVTDEDPSSAGDVLDLDTGHRYAVIYRARIARYTHRCVFEHEITSGQWNEVEHVLTSEREADEMLAHVVGRTTNVRNARVEAL